MDSNLLQACDQNFRHANSVFFGTSLTGEVVESHDVQISHTGFPTRDFNRALLKPGCLDPEAAIRRTQAYFDERQLPFVVTVRAAAQNAPVEVLEAQGYQPVGEFPGMLLTPIRDASRPIAGLGVTRVRSPEQLERFQRTAFEGFGFPPEAGRLLLTEHLIEVPGVELYLGTFDGEPATTSCLVASGAIAGIYWVATVQRHRQHGLGEALTWAAIRAGMERGCRVASLQASTMGAPVYARMGFETPIRYRDFARR